MSEAHPYHTLEELRKLSTEALQMLWDSVPVERQRSYRDAYERELRAAGAEGSDRRERQIALELLRRYHDVALVPVGTRWARTPTRVQASARASDGYPTDNTESQQNTGRPSPKVVFALGGAVLLMVALVFLRPGRGENAAVMSTPTATPLLTTPTPLALDAADDVIGGGDSGRAVSYPITLQVSAGNDEPPRVWVVQRRTVRTSEWNYDPNPDTASFLSGMSVHPVIGIPYSEANAAWFDAISTGATFILQMNTGAILTYHFADKRTLRRSDTEFFRQIAPGLALLLIGETDETGLPTAERTLISADYPPEQELSRTGGLADVLALPTLSPVVPTAPVVPAPFAGLDAQVIAATYGNGAISIRLRLYNGSTTPILLTSNDIWLALGYTANPVGPHIPAENLAPFSLLPDQAANVNLVWAWNDEPFATLAVGDYRFGCQLQ